MKNRGNKKESPSKGEIPNGAAAAAILSAGAGCFCVSVCGLLGDAFPAAANFFKFYAPTGPLSGVTTTAIMIWLVLWFWLFKAWDGKKVRVERVNVISFILLGMGLLLSFPPFGDLLLGK